MKAQASASGQVLDHYRAKYQDRIRCAKDTGQRNLPLKGFAQNQLWCEIAALACELLAWTQMLALPSAGRRWEPKQLRLRVFAAAGNSVRIIKTPVRSRRANFFAERYVGTLRRECPSLGSLLTRPDPTRLGRTNPFSLQRRRAMSEAVCYRASPPDVIASSVITAGQRALVTRMRCAVPAVSYRRKDAVVT